MKLSDQASQLVDAARAGGPSPGSQARARMKRAVLATVAAPATAAAGAGATATKPLIALLSSTLGKLALGTAAVIVGAGGTWSVLKPAPGQQLLARGRPEVSPAIVARSKPAPAAEPLAGAVTPRIQPDLEVSPPPLRRALDPTPPIPDRPTTEPEQESVASLARQPTATQELTLREELQLLQQAMDQHEAQQWAPALQNLDRYQSQFPHGELWAEAQALRVLILCGLERTEEAREVAQTLLAAAPQSPAVQRVKTSCAKP
jgi:hypothetical protein